MQYKSPSGSRWMCMSYVTDRQMQKHNVIYTYVRWLKCHTHQKYQALSILYCPITSHEPDNNTRTVSNTTAVIVS